MKPRCIFPQWLKPFIMLVFIVALSFGGILNTTAFAGGPTPLSPLDTQDDVSISNVAISSIKGQPDSVLIKWRTSLPVKAWVEYGSHPNKLDYVAYNTRGADTTTRTHKILIRGIDPNNFYFYIVLANGHRFGNAGKAFQFVTTLRNPVSVVAEPVQVAQVSTITSNKTLDMATQIEPTLDTQSKTNIEANSPDSTAPILAPDSEQQATSSSSEAGQIQSEVTASAQDSTTTAFVATIPSMKLPWASGTYPLHNRWVCERWRG